MSQDFWGRVVLDDEWDRVQARATTAEAKIKELENQLATARRDVLCEAMRELVNEAEKSFQRQPHVVIWDMIHNPAPSQGEKP